MELIHLMRNLLANIKVIIVSFLRCVVWLTKHLCDCCQAFLLCWISMLLHVPFVNNCGDGALRHSTPIWKIVCHYLKHRSIVTKLKLKKKLKMTFIVIVLLVVVLLINGIDGYSGDCGLVFPVLGAVYEQTCMSQNPKQGFCFDNLQYER
jgi:hypothetical protein